jgi:hypothetical protein
MKKLALRLDDLKVESFGTGDRPAPSGTVHANDRSYICTEKCVYGTDDVCWGYTYDGTCDGSCNGTSCNGIPTYAAGCDTIFGCGCA